MNDPLLFFTSNARSLYRRDILNLCTEPENAFIRFGYDKKWIGESLGQRLVIGTKVLIIYSEVIEPIESNLIEFLIRKKKKPNLNFIPIRLAEIVSSEVVKEAFIIDLKLETFFEPSTDSVQPQNFQEYLKSIPNYPNLNNPNRKFVLASGFSTSENGYSFEYGNPTVKETLKFTQDCLPLLETVKKVNGLKDCHFILGQKSTALSSVEMKKKKDRSTTLSSADSANEPSREEFLRPHFCLPTPNFEGKNVSYTLKAGENYSVKLLVVSGDEAKHDQIPNLTIEETIPTVSVLGPFVKQNPFGFETEFIVHCKHSLYEEWGGLFVRIKPNEEKNAEEEIYKSSEIFALINVKRDNSFIAIFFLIPLSILLTFTGPDFIGAFSDNSLNKFLCEFICVSPLYISGFFKILGVGFSFWASYILTKKVSFK